MSIYFIKSGVTMKNNLFSSHVPRDEWKKNKLLGRLTLTSDYQGK